ncbi:hypothetical protein BKA93DRAFT_931493 [Sparassis latifolia]
MAPYLHGIYQKAIYSLETFGSPDLCKASFEPLTYDRAACFLPISPPVYVSEVGHEFTESQIIFEVIGQISAEERGITKIGEDSAGVPSCFIEARPDFVSGILWHRIPAAIDAIAAAIPGPVDVSSIVRTDPETGTCKLKVIWGGRADTPIPMYNCAGVHIHVDIEQLHDRPVRALFWVHCMQFEAKKVLFAQLIFVADI